MKIIQKHKARKAYQSSDDEDSDLEIAAQSVLNQELDEEAEKRWPKEEEEENLVTKDRL
jgi:hypothetical protein